jgi:transcriptional regulator with XRE-family HTH domain
MFSMWLFPALTKLHPGQVRPGLAAALEIRWARNDAGLSQKALGKLAGNINQQQIAKLEDPDENPSLETLAKVGRALGLEVSVAFEKPDRLRLPPETPPLAVREATTLARWRGLPPAAKRESSTRAKRRTGPRR